ncbi:ribonuclease P 40kDa subunit-domain-containing protein [Lipomyces arxii]|uniref:ribonuclease P 40kDa subunit-domain-containing protein n=1 Tax=Lipomyces arxii TaxID=56418 RepID=UPI0034CDA656
MSTSFSLVNKTAESKVYVSLSSPEAQLKKIITEHHFNRRLEILLPSDIYDGQLQSLIELNGISFGTNSKYYHTTTSLGSFLKSEYLDPFIKQNNCLVLSLGSIDRDDVYCIYDGVLRLSLRKETFERAGLQGKLSSYSKSRYIVQFDLRRPSMVLGNKAFDRLVWATENSPLRQPVQFLVRTYLAAKSSSSLPELPVALNAVPYEPTCLISHYSDEVIVPPLYPNKSVLQFKASKYHSVDRRIRSEYAVEVLKEGLLHILEWTALLSVESERIQASNQIDPLLSTYQVFADDNDDENDPKRRSCKVTKIAIEGFLGVDMVYDMFKSLQDRLPMISWAVFTVNGFEDAPVSWKSDEHSFLISGDNDYAIVIRPGRTANNDRSTIVYEIVGSADAHS